MTKAFDLRIFPIIGALLALASHSSPAQESGGARQWTNAAGKTIEATLLNATDETATLKLATGKVVEVGIATLSTADQNTIAEMRDSRAVLPPMVESIPVPPEGSHFELSGQGELEKRLLGELESIFAVADALPFSLNPVPGLNQDRYQIKMTDTAGYRSFLSSLKIDPNDKPSAAFLVDEVALYLNYMNIRGDKLTPQKRAEIKHEAGKLVLMKWNSILPPWLYDGLAGCVASVPVERGVAKISNSEDGLKQFLTARFVLDTKPVRVSGAGKLMSAGSNDPEIPTDRDRAGAVMLTYFFLYLDNKAAPAGVPLAQALGSVKTLEKKSEGQLQSEESALDSYEKKRVAFNKKVAEYNMAVNQHREAVMAFNANVAKFNEQMKAGVPVAERIEVGEAPVPPVAPVAPVKPGGDAMETGEAAGKKEDKAYGEILTALLHGRSIDELEAEVEDAFDKIGIRVSFE